jgi:hypothetical protein
MMTTTQSAQMTITTATQKPMTANESLIWCAGFFEAGGRIQVNKPTNSAAIALAVTINHTSVDTLYFFQRTIGCGSIARHRSSNTSPKALCRWQIGGYAAGVVLKNILPWLVVKRPQALLAIEIADTVGHTHPVPPETIARRTELAAEIRKLRDKAKERP